MHSFCVYNQSLAQWLEHWISVQGVLGSNPARGGSFSAMPYFSSLQLSCRKMGALIRDGTLLSKDWLCDIINDDFLEMGMCYEYLHIADHADHA